MAEAQFFSRPRCIVCSFLVIRIQWLCTTVPLLKGEGVGGCYGGAGDPTREEEEHYRSHSKRPYYLYNIFFLYFSSERITDCMRGVWVEWCMDTPNLGGEVASNEAFVCGGYYLVGKEKVMR